MRHLQRYRDGAHEQVWAELIAVGADWRDEEHDREEALALARETMRRVVHNVQVLEARLPELGYRFAHPDAVHVQPTPDISAKLDEVERVIGKLPLALRVFFETVGAVDFTGTHPDWDHPCPDPLVVDAPPDYILSEYEWQHEEGLITPERPFQVPFAPDYLHKADISGGLPYGIAVPNAGLDGLVLGDVHQTTFTNYLRIAFRFAGFPGWSSRPHRDDERPAFPEALQHLARELQPL
jgi:hypothetical protein